MFLARWRKWCTIFKEVLRPLYLQTSIKLSDDLGTCVPGQLPRSLKILN